MNISLLINKFLSNKQHLLNPEKDLINIINNQIVVWNFENIPQPTEAELLALEAEVLSEQSRKEKIAQIVELEKQISPRMIREALLNSNNSAIEAIEAQIQAIRALL